jgi:hypothetical protein
MKLTRINKWFYQNFGKRMSCLKCGSLNVNWIGYDLLKCNECKLEDDRIQWDDKVCKNQ